MSLSNRTKVLSNIHLSGFATTFQRPFNKFRHALSIWLMHTHTYVKPVVYVNYVLMLLHSKGLSYRSEVDFSANTKCAIFQLPVVQNYTLL